MKVFTIENETNNITLHATIQDAEAVANTEQFRNEAGLANLAASWPSARLIEIWNSLPGAVPVKKFKDRATAVTRIWKSIQSLDASVPAGLASDQPINLPNRKQPSDRAKRPRLPKTLGKAWRPCRIRPCATNARRRAAGGSRNQQGHPDQESAQARNGEGDPPGQQDQPRD